MARNGRLKANESMTARMNGNERVREKRAVFARVLPCCHSATVVKFLVVMNDTHTKQDGGAVIVPEWITVEQACKFAAISKPVLYGWMNRGLVKNFSARERGQVRGVRRVSFDSLRAFLDSRSTGGMA